MLHFVPFQFIKWTACVNDAEHLINNAFFFFHIIFCACYQIDFEFSNASWARIYHCPCEFDNFASNFNIKQATTSYFDS